MKNALIIILTVLCAVLAYMQVNDKTDDIVEGKIDRTGAIAIAEIEGISLSTEVDLIDAIAKKSGFMCKKSDHIKTVANNSVQVINWNCSYTEDRKTILSVTSQDSKIMQISRQGPTSFKKAVVARDHADKIKSRLSTREAVSFNQTPTQTSLHITNKTDQVHEQIQYNIVTIQTKNIDGKIEKSALYRGLAFRR